MWTMCRVVLVVVFVHIASGTFPGLLWPLAEDTQRIPHVSGSGTGRNSGSLGVITAPPPSGSSDRLRELVLLDRRLTFSWVEADPFGTSLNVNVRSSAGTLVCGSGCPFSACLLGFNLLFMSREHWFSILSSRVLFPISLSTWCSSKLSCSLEIIPGHFGGGGGGCGWPARVFASLCNSSLLLTASSPRSWVCWLIWWFSCCSSSRSCSRSADGRAFPWLATSDIGILSLSLKCPWEGMFWWGEYGEPPQPPWVPYGL